MQQDSPMVSFVNIILMSKFKQHMLQLIKQFSDVANRKNSNSNPKKPSVMLLTVKILVKKLVLN